MKWREQNISKLVLALGDKWPNPINNGPMDYGENFDIVLNLALGYDLTIR